VTGPGGTAETTFAWTVTAEPTLPTPRAGEPKAEGTGTTQQAPTPTTLTIIGDLLLMLVQLETPDAIRGRVSAVNGVFIGASNELGEFESGLTAAWFGLVPAVVIGGVATLLVAVLWMRWFPALRSVDRFPGH